MGLSPAVFSLAVSRRTLQSRMLRWLGVGRFRLPPKRGFRVQGGSVECGQIGWSHGLQRVSNVFHRFDAARLCGQGGSFVVARNKRPLTATASRCPGNAGAPFGGDGRGSAPAHPSTAIADPRMDPAGGGRRSASRHWPLLVPGRTTVTQVHRARRLCHASRPAGAAAV